MATQAHSPDSRLLAPLNESVSPITHTSIMSAPVGGGNNSDDEQQDKVVRDNSHMSDTEELIAPHAREHDEKESSLSEGKPKRGGELRKRKNAHKVFSPDHVADGYQSLSSDEDSDKEDAEEL